MDAGMPVGHHLDVNALTMDLPGGPSSRRTPSSPTRRPGSYAESVVAPFVREVRLTAFKSYRDAVLPLDAVTVLTGRNSSGKSNALDGIEVLGRLASGEDLADALDGRRREDGPSAEGRVAARRTGPTRSAWVARCRRERRSTGSTSPCRSSPICESSRSRCTGLHRH
jgi:AAA domain, putative AbiEii toxin, Type IV TA system